MVAKFKKTKKDQSIFFSILLLILFIGVIGSLVYSNWRINKKRGELLTKIESLKKEIQTLEERNTELRTGITKTQSEDYQKEKLYEQGYIEKGAEQVVVLPPEEGKEETTPVPKNLWQKILEILKLRD